MAQLVNFIIYRRILLNISVCRRNIRLRLIVVIIGHKILYCIFRKEFPKFRTKLSSKSLIVCEDECRTIKSSNNIGHGKCFSRTGNAEQRLFVEAAFNAINKLVYCLRLIAHGRILRMENEFIHIKNLIFLFHTPQFIRTAAQIFQPLTLQISLSPYI